MKGYKAVNRDGTAKHGDAVYEVGGTYTCEGKLVPCVNGIHFCERLADVFRYYDVDARVFEVEAMGRVVTEGDKSCTDELTVLSEVPRAEVLELANAGQGNSGVLNSGNFNSGHGNSGDYNSGNFNSGHGNSGDRNSGDFNSGHRNSGNFNSGNFNSGHRNSGNFNSGNFNSGHRNSGDWNITSYSSGVLCTEEPECLIFDMPSGMTLREWRESEAASIMGRIEVDCPEWKSWRALSPEERELHAGLECQGGMLVEPRSTAPRFKAWWESLTDRERGVIMAIPNFDADKWKMITGIEVGE